MGLLLCVGAFAMAFTSAFAIVAGIHVYSNAADFGDPGGVLRHESSEFAAFAAVAALSAFAGARSHARWLADHRRSAASSGAFAGSITAAVLLVLVALGTSAPRPIATTALLVGRFAFLLAPGVVTHLVLRAKRRREATARDVPED